jgi:hypothetical protein
LIGAGGLSGLSCGTGLLDGRLLESGGESGKDPRGVVMRAKGIGKWEGISCEMCLWLRLVVAPGGTVDS